MEPTEPLRRTIIRMKAGLRKAGVPRFLLRTIKPFRRRYKKDFFVKQSDIWQEAVNDLIDVIVHRAKKRDNNQFASAFYKIGPQGLKLIYFGKMRFGLKKKWPGLVERAKRSVKPRLKQEEKKALNGLAQWIHTTNLKPVAEARAKFGFVFVNSHRELVFTDNPFFSSDPYSNAADTRQY